MNEPSPSLPPRILIVDDNTAIHEDFRKILAHQSGADNRLGDAERALFGGLEDHVERAIFRVDSAYQGKEALEMIEQSLRDNDPYRMAFVDVRMPPGWDGVETLERVWKCYPELQAVICTAYSDYSWDEVVRRLGQTDKMLILKKPFEMVEVLQLAHALTQKWALSRQAQLRMEDLDRMVRERTEALRISEERFSKAFQASPMPMAIQTHPEGRFLDANASFFELVGYTTSQLLQHTADELRLWDDDPKPQTSEPHIRNRSCMLRRSDGATRNAVLWAEPIQLENKSCLLLIMEDVTDELKLENQLRQAQKMEAVGRLASGIAHEFNNILTIIQGHAALVLAKPDDARFAADSATRITQATQRAAALTNQMLAFSRRQLLQLKPVNLSLIVRTAQKMIQRVMGERCDLHLSCADSLPLTTADENSIEQILINLALNARDAMPDGGKLRVATSQEVLDESAVSRNPDARPGRFVCLIISDTGAGMGPEVVNRVFDPFFTTKEVGKGTGLGLSMILGIVQQHQGWIEVTSQVGQGTTFKVFLPACEEVSSSTPANALTPAFTTGNENGETVLVVEDEADVRDLTCAALKQGGYRVFEAADGNQALQVWDKSSVPIRLLLTDIIMPNGINGGSLAKTLQGRNPKLRVLYISGYGAEVIKDELPSGKDTHFLPKPYDPAALLSAVKHCLGGNGSSPAKAR